MRFVLILGANSDIARAVAIEYAKNGQNLILTSRKKQDLHSFASDLSIRYGISTEVEEFDVLNLAEHSSFCDAVIERTEGVLIAIGLLNDNEALFRDFKALQQLVDTNYTGVVSILNEFAMRFKARKSGFIVAISSVAGERGRRSNFFYGSSKSALSAYLSGLRSYLCKYHVPVTTVKPGFVATKMTEGMDFPKILSATPETVAKDIVSAQRKRKDHLYSPWYWGWIIFCLKRIPERLFKHLDI
ncbi:MAG: short-chain dehydrogenase [Acidobacteria bacterium]|nr:MAG: short-chain dehydrogenase [Acidobacteriota bacterium]